MKGLVRKRKDGRWEGRIELTPDPLTKRRKRKYVYADTKRECQRLVNEIVHDLETGNFADAGKLTIKSYMEKWLGVYSKKLAASTQQSHKIYVENHINKYFVDMRLRDLRPMDVDKFYNLERDKKYSEKTILQIHRIFSRAMKDAVKNGLIAHNPCVSVDAPSPIVFEPNVPDVELYYEILTCAVGTEHEIPVLLAGLCGLRRSEVFGLTYNDIDFGNATLTVRQAAVMAGKEIDIKRPKSKTSARTISIPAEVLNVLKESKKVGFVVSKDGNITHPGNYTDRYTMFLKTNKLPHIRFHDLRHFHATLLLDAGVDIKLAQARMGHANIGQTAYYQHIRRKPKADFAVVEQMGNFIIKSRGGQSGGQVQNSEEVVTGESV